MFGWGKRLMKMETKIEECNTLSKDDATIVAAIFPYHWDLLWKVVCFPEKRATTF